MRAHVVAMAVLLVPPPALAQNEHSDLGFQLGYSRARFSADQTGLGESRSGSLFGAFVGIPVAGPFSAQTELFLAKKGGGLTTVVEGIPLQLSLQLVYIEVPLLARVAIPLGGRLHPNLFAGGSVALNIGCDIQAEIPGLVGQRACDEAGGISAHAFDFGAVFGAGLEYDWRGSSARLEARQVMGLREVLPEGGTKNRAWAILFGITL